MTCRNCGCSLLDDEELRRECCFPCLEAAGPEEADELESLDRIMQPKRRERFSDLSDREEGKE